MCKCTPNIRTPFCGAPGCEWPPEWKLKSPVQEEFPTVGKQTWDVFRATGLLWWVNMILHTFGWALVMVMDDRENIIDAYPCRVAYRGFPAEANDEGYTKVAAYLAKNAAEMDREIR